MAMSLIIFFALLATVMSVASLARSPQGVIVNLRVEGAKRTIYEGPVFTRAHNITTANGGTHICDGTNDESNPGVSPDPTVTTALDDAAHLAHFTWDGTYDLISNYHNLPITGCYHKLTEGEHILWAWNFYGTPQLLTLTGPTSVRKGHPFTVTVTAQMGDEPTAPETRPLGCQGWRPNDKCRRKGHPYLSKSGITTT